MEKLLTVSVAAYKVEKYIKNTLESCVIPEIMEELEVLVIVDGVCDRTPDIAEEYEKKYPDTFRVIIKENGGYGTTVNYGVKEAKGKFFKLLDGDDTFDREGLIDLVNFLKNNKDTDLVITPSVEIDEDTGEKKIFYAEKIELLNKLSGKTIKVSKIRHYFHSGIWNDTVRTELLKKNLKKLPGNTLFTDVLFVLGFLPFVKKVSFTTIPVYIYLIRSRDFDLKTCEDQIEQVCYVIKKGLKIYADNSDTENDYFFLRRMSVYYEKCLFAIMSIDASKKRLDMIKKMDRFCKKNANKVFIKTNESRKILLLRKSRYNYFIYKMLCRGFKNRIREINKVF